MQMEDAPRGTGLITRSSGFLGQALAEDLTARYPASPRHRSCSKTAQRREPLSILRLVSLVCGAARAVTSIMGLGPCGRLV
jgi:hypothetical protein